MAHLNIDLNDLTTSALKRLVTQLITAKDGDEKKILDRLNQSKAPHKNPAKNDLADLHEEMHGKPNTPEVEEDDHPFDLEAGGGDDESDDGASRSDMQPKKRGGK